MSSWLNNWVKSQIEKEVGSRYQVELTIDRLRGDLWKEFLLSDLQVKYENETIFTADTLYAHYDIWSLISSEITIDEITIVKPYLNIRQNPDGTYHLPGLGDERVQDDSEKSGTHVGVSSLVLVEGALDAQIKDLSIDSTIAIQHIGLNSSLQFYGDSFSFNLENLVFSAGYSGTDKRVNVHSSGRSDDNLLTLEHLVMAGGHTLIQSAGRFQSKDSALSLNISALPLAWEDAVYLSKHYPIRQDLQIELQVDGSLNDLNTVLSASGIGVREFELRAGFTVNPSFSLNKLNIKSDYLDLARLFPSADIKYPTLNNLNLSMQGMAPFNDIRQSRLNGMFQTGEVVYDNYSIQSSEGEIGLDGNHLKTILKLTRGKEIINTTFATEKIWATNPDFNLTAEAVNLNPGYWLNESSWSGNVNLRAELKGSGYSKEDRFWKYKISSKNGVIGKQRYTGVESDGEITADGLTSNSSVHFDEGKILFNVGVDKLSREPEYEFDIQLQHLDLSKIRGFEAIKTDFNGSLEGKGSHLEIDNLTLNSTFNLNSSVINDEIIQSFSGHIHISDTVAVIDSVSLESAIADGNFDARLHLTRFYDPANRLEMDLNLKDIEALSTIPNVEKIQAFGQISGQLAPIYGDNLKFQGIVNLRNIEYNGIFSSEQANGKVEILVTEYPEYVLNIDLQTPIINSLSLQDLNLTARGEILEDHSNGNIQVTFNSPSGNRFQQFGEFMIFRDSVTVNTIDLRMISALRTLSLEHSFRFSYANEIFQMDTLHVRSSDGAFLKLIVPHASQDRVQGLLEGRNLNMTVIQKTLLNESFIGGILSGKIAIESRDTLINADADFTIEGVEYKSIKFDSLTTNFKIGDDRFDGELTLNDKGTVIAKGGLKAPFRIDDPIRLPDSFFEKPVEGYLQIPPLQISRFRELLTEAGITNTRGLFTLNGSLSGTADNPKMEASIILSSGTLSGVPIDSVNAGFNYVHEQSGLNINLSVISLNQKAADLNIGIPLYVDFRRFTVDLPDSTDPIDASLTSNDFNLSALNDFLNRSRYREITGKLNGEVSVDGIIGDPLTRGRIQLTNGSLRVVKAGIKIDKIQSEVRFKEDTIDVVEFRARSGRGTFNLNGKMSLNRLRPDSVDLKMNAENFRIANTSEYAGVINMNAHIGNTAFKPVLTGNINFRNGYVYLRNFGEKSVETVDLDTTFVPDYNVLLYDSLAIDMEVNFDRRFFVRNRQFLDLEAELSGELNLTKESGRDVQLYGTLFTVGGYARPLGKRFTIDEGNITFTGDITNPNLNVRTSFEPPQPQSEVKIWYIMEGTVEKPKFKYESNPPMELQNIISYTLFGQPFYALDSWKQVVTNSSSNTTAGDVALNLILDRVESLATQKLGIDVVQIDNTGGSGETGTSIKTGWYINPKVFFAIQNEITGTNPDTIFILEYLIKKNLKLIIMQGSDNREGIDLRWNHDY